MGTITIFPLLFTILLQFNLFFVQTIFAQSGEVTSAYQISDPEAQDDDILTVDPQKGIIRAKESYDSRLFGVLSSQAALVYRPLETPGKPVMRGGVATVSVTTLGGAINAGDYITSSQIPGKGQKATLSGYVLGTALTSFTENDGEKIDYQVPGSSDTKKVASGKISVALQIEYAEITKSRSLSRFADSALSSLFTSLEDSSQAAQIFRYLTAGTVVLASFLIAFFTFSRSVPKSIEAIGRNPLASRMIIFSIVLNIILTLVVAAAGITAAMFILRL